MSEDAMLPCFVCGVTLKNTFYDAANQPSEGTEFRTFGHYGSTFWDSFEGEEIVVNVCDDCLRKHTDRIARQKRYVYLRCDGVEVGRASVRREMVPFFDGPEDEEGDINISPEDIGVAESYGRVEWIRNWQDYKESLLIERRKK